MKRREAKTKLKLNEKQNKTKNTIIYMSNRVAKIK
jgi:hypothetical protein